MVCWRLSFFRPAGWQRSGKGGAGGLGHGSDATWMETRGVRDGDGWRITGTKMWNTGLHVATHDLIFARTSGKDGDPRGITCFIVPTKSDGFVIEEYLWTFNMPTDHPRVSLHDVYVPADAILGDPQDGLAVALHFVHENRIRQAASSLGAAQYCINEAVKYSMERKPFGKPLSANQAIQWPLVELQTEAAMIRALLYQTAWEMDQMSKPEVAVKLSDKVSMWPQCLIPRIHVFLTYYALIHVNWLIFHHLPFNILSFKYVVKSGDL